MFKADLATIDKMRADAVNVREPHVSGLVRLGAYAAVLFAASGKFPVDVCFVYSSESFRAKQKLSM